jgi:hypothetical protein
VTTDSNHNFRVYPNLAGSLDLTGIDQLWIADITYILSEHPKPAIDDHLKTGQR